MAIREIVQHTDSFIRKHSKPVKVFDEKLWELIDDMWETLDNRVGAGLSAVQVQSDRTIRLKKKTKVFI